MSTSTSDRTRAAVLDAAIRVWGRDRGAALGAIAAEAGVARTTVHRLYSERADLLRAVEEHARARYGAAMDRARPEDDTGWEALVRIGVELLDLGDLLTIFLADKPLFEPEDWLEGPERGERFTEVVARGRADGSLDPRLPVAWSSLVVWLLLAGAWMALDGGHAGKADVRALWERTLAGAIGPKADPTGA